MLFAHRQIRSDANTPAGVSDDVIGDNAISGNQRPTLLQISFRTGQRGPSGFRSCGGQKEAKGATAGSNTYRPRHVDAELGY